MTVIMFANPKGGTGKTTCAMLLAEHMVLSRQSVAVLDLDPNGAILNWARARKKAGRELPFEVHERPQVDEDTVKLLRRLRETFDYVIVDLEGSRDEITLRVLSCADLCLIPSSGSSLEVQPVEDMVGTIRRFNEKISRKRSYRVVLARTHPPFRINDEKEFCSLLEADGIPVLQARIHRLASYTSIFRYNLFLSEMPDWIRGQPWKNSKKKTMIEQVERGIKNARTYGRAVVRHCNEEFKP